MSFNTIFLFVIMAMLLLAIAAVLILLITVIAKCKGWHLRFYIKLGPLVLLIDTSAESLVTKVAQ